MQILLVIFRKTYGYNKKEDKISLTTFSELTNMTTSNCSRAIKKLEKMNLITVKRDQYISIYQIQKDYDKWQILSKPIVIGTIQNDSKDTITLESDTIQKDSKTTIQNDRYKRKKESLKESKERETSLTSQKITSENIKELFTKHTRISNPNPETHITPILKILKTIPPELTEDDVGICLTQTFSKLRKENGVMMNFLLENIKKSISVKHEEILSEKKKKELSITDVERERLAKAKIIQHNENAKKYLKETAEKIIKYSEFFTKNKLLFSTMEKYEIETAFKNNSVMLVENIFLNKMDSSYV